MSKKRVAIVGSSGRMGQRVARLLCDSETLILGATLDAGEEAQTAFSNADVVIDFSAPAACQTLLPLAASLGIPYVVASTGLTDADHAAIDRAAKQIAVVQASNLSLGVNVMLELVELAAKRLGTGFDIEISETHHRHKRDAPSGTALSLGKAAQAGRGPLQTVLRQEGMSEPRADNELGYGVLRGGDVSGDHTVYYFGNGERIEITHRSSTADIFAQGAIRAATWLMGHPAGRYTMAEVLRSC